MIYRMSFDEFIRQFPIVIPWQVLIGCCVVAAVASVLAMAFAPKRWRFRAAVLAWMVACVVVMLDVTVFSRPSSDDVVRFMRPFWCVTAILEGNSTVISEKIYNVLFFMPFGLLCGLFFTRRTMPRSLFAALCLSVTIELLQLVTRTGTCELDDVICNLAGGFTGVSVVILIRYFSIIFCKFAGNSV